MYCNFRKIRVLLFACFIGTVMVMPMTGCASLLGFGEDDEEIDTLDEEFEEEYGESGGGEVEELQAEIKELTSRQSEAQDKIQDLEGTIGSLESSLSDLRDSKRAIEDRLDDLGQSGGGDSDQEVERLRQKLADLQESITEIKSRAGKRSGQREYREERGSRGGREARGGRDSRRSRGSSSRGGMSVKRSYDKAIQLYNSRRYDDALSVLEEISGMNPPIDLADNILFWTGQCSYKLGEFERAIDRFHNVIDDYPMGNKIHDARYMLGLSYDAIGEKSKAVDVLYNALDEGPPSGIKNRIKAAIRKIE